MPSKLTFVGIVAMLLLAGCGGSSKTKTTKSTNSKTSTKTTHSSTSKAPAPPKAATLAEVVVVAGSHSAASNSAKAKTGDGVEFLTKVPGTASSAAVKVHLDFDKLSPTKWNVTASVKGQKSSTATLNSKDGSPLLFSELHYGCALPPSATFCPVSHTLANSTHIKAQFTATPATPIAIATKIGPPPVGLAPVPASTLVAPTYTVQTTLLAVAAHPSKPAAPARLSSTASVHPGDHVLIRIRVTGKVVGAPQPLTLTFAQGPSQQIGVTASVPGGTVSTGTITSATGKKIEVVLPRFGCLLPPSPTFCPPANVQAASHKYTVTFKVTPKTPPIAIQAVAQGG